MIVEELSEHAINVLANVYEIWDCPRRPIRANIISSRVYGDSSFSGMIKTALEELAKYGYVTEKKNKFGIAYYTTSKGLEFYEKMLLEKEGVAHESG